MRELVIGEVTQNGTALLVGQERIETGAIILVQRSCLIDAAIGVGVLAHLGNNTARKDKVVVYFVKQDGDEVVPVGGRLAISTIIPRRPAVHGDENIILAVFSFLLVEIFAANRLGSSDGEDSIEEVRELDKVGTTSSGEEILVAQVGEDNLHFDNDGRYPGLLDNLLALGNDGVDVDGGGDIENMDLEERVVTITCLWREGFSTSGGL